MHCDLARHVAHRRDGMEPHVLTGKIQIRSSSNCHWQRLRISAYMQSLSNNDAIALLDLLS